MHKISSAEAHGLTFVFEPPVSVPDSEPSNLSLARLATFAWYGAKAAYGIGHQLTESMFDELIAENEHDPEVIASELTTNFQHPQSDTAYTVTLVE